MEPFPSGVTRVADLEGQIADQKVDRRGEATTQSVAHAKTVGQQTQDAFAIPGDGVAFSSSMRDCGCSGGEDSTTW
jgi:hypothetical protein